MKIFVSIISARDWKCMAAVSFAVAFNRLCEEYGTENVHLTLQPACPNPADGREQAVLSFLKTDCTHLIFFDDDMRIDRETFVELIKHDKPAVGIDYAKKCVQPYSTTACSTKEAGYKKFYNHKGLKAAGNMGFGAVVFQRWALEQMDLPRFGHRWMPHDEHPRHTTEDTVFFENMISKGIQPYVDLDLSWKCGHIGDIEFQLQEVSADAIQVDDKGNPIEKDKYEQIAEPEKCGDKKCTK